MWLIVFSHLKKEEIGEVKRRARWEVLLSTEINYEINELKYQHVQLSDFTILEKGELINEENIKRN